jgi:hypothetical protein
MKKKVIVAGNNNFGLIEQIKNVLTDYDITFMSTTDRTGKATKWLYNAEKKTF